MLSAFEVRLIQAVKSKSSSCLRKKPSCELWPICQALLASKLFLTYCHLVWHFCKASDTRKLERLQERGLRAVFKDNNSTYEQLLEKADLPTLLNSRLQDLCILMYKVKHKLCPTYISNIFKEPNSNYNLRQADFSIPRYETVTYGKHSIRYLGPKLWTKLPKNIRDITTLTSFKSKIRQLNISELLDDGCAGCSLCSS